MTHAEACAALGRRVVYRSPFYGGERHGELKYVAGAFAFVRYDRSYNAQATAPELLELEEAA